MPQTSARRRRRADAPSVVAGAPPVEAVAEVRRNTALSADAFLLDLMVDMPAALPGQFVMLGLPDGAAPLLRRPFSVMGHDPSRKSLEIHYSARGAGTRVLSELRPGHKLGLLGPLGRHFPQAAEVARRPADLEGGLAPLSVLVAGGRGTAPLIFFAERARRSVGGSSGPVLFLAGARTAAQLVLLDRIHATEVFVSTDDGSAGKKDTVIGLLKSLDGQPDFALGAAGRETRRRPGAVLYGCGPAGMLRELHSYAESRGLPCFVSLEARMACGLGVCQGCAVRLTGSRYALVCKEGPVFESCLVDWAQYEGA
ncbi:MAG: dihydroorotate dehydrogenase electron transfer subunit [Candidatus Eisenbacteria bacterium]|nr:dihydroorotate dehydrogenase electron transfer subunit [Candidatus Eisenbacteria bacterium]